MQRKYCPTQMQACHRSDRVVLHAAETILVRVPYDQNRAISSNRLFLAGRRAYTQEECIHLSLVTTCNVGKCQSNNGTDIAWASFALFITSYDMRAREILSNISADFGEFRGTELQIFHEEIIKPPFLQMHRPVQGNKYLIQWCISVNNSH